MGAMTNKNSETENVIEFSPAAVDKIAQLITAEGFNVER